MDAEEYIFTSIVDPAAYTAPGATGVMPTNIAQGLSDEQLLSLTALLCSRGGPVRPARIVRLADKIPLAAPTASPQMSLESLERGKALFLGKLGCSKCHSLYPSPGYDLAAPSLLGIGHQSRADLRDKILRPKAHIKAGYETWEVVRKGVPCAGRRVPDSAGAVGLLVVDPAGNVNLRTFRQVELEPFDNGEVVHRSATTPMPSFEGAMTEEELEALLDFLYTLR
jgi:hypothetical protein